MPPFEIVETELIQWLEDYDGPRFHAILSDPPYALISIAKRFGKPNQAPAQQGADGRYARLSGGFMGQSWDSFESYEKYREWITKWAKLLIEKALYPGAVCLFFGGTRTWHHLGLGLEEGGFEIVNTLMWLYGSGFPKSITVSRDANLCSLQDDACQCDEDKHNSAHTFPLHSVLDRIGTAGALAQEASDVSTSDPSATNKSQDFQGDYHLLGHSHGESLRHLAMVALAFLRPPIYVRERNRFFALSDEQAYESLHSLYPALCNGLPSMQGYFHPSVLQPALRLLQECEDGQSLVKHWSTILSMLAGELDVQALMGDDISVLRNSHICNLVFSLPTSILLVLCHKKADTIIPQVYICGKCRGIKNPYVGYSSHLKPAWEPVYLCRAPRGGATFASLAVEHGSGALNIDGGRISTSDNLEVESKGWASARHQGYRRPWMDNAEKQLFGSNKGRWPANLLLTHHADCVKVGEFEVEGRTINRWQEEMKPFGGGAGEEYESEQLPSEMVERFACVPECPVRQLDDQAGELKAGITVGRNASEGRVYGGGRGLVSQPRGDERVGYNESGGPSRFFYTGKASRREKDKGLESFYWKRVGTGFEPIGVKEYETLPKRERAKGCIHPAVKPIELLRYLATLILPPEQEGKPRRILVPFSGSGSEVIAARQAGWDEVVGVEMDENYNEIARARLAATLGMF